MEWPSRTQFEALANRVEGAEDETTAVKNRVTTLESAGGITGPSRWPGLPLPVDQAAARQAIYGAYYRWERRSVHVAGVRIYGADVPLTALGGISVQRRGSSESLPWDQLQPVARYLMETGGVPIYTDFLFGRSILVSDGQLNVTFVNVFALPVDAAESLPDGLSISFQDSAGNTVMGSGVPMVPLSTMLLEVPIQPVPSAPAYGVDSDEARHMEVVWPAGGPPYLHVYRAHDGSSEEHYHLPLTPGLPQ